MGYQVREVATKPYDGQKPGTSGLRKRFSLFPIFDSIRSDGATLVIGGDGRYFSPETVQTILRIGSANGVKKFIVGRDAILSTPAASNASHNPGGPNNDFGIKYNVSNGGPAPENVTNRIYEVTKTIQRYKVIEADPVDLSKIGETTYGPSQVQIIDSEIFDFPLIKDFLHNNAQSFRVLFDGLHGVTGPYARAILIGKLGLPEAAVQNCVPLPDFGGGTPRPQPHLLRIRLVEVVEKNNIQFGAASDGDGDRNMIYGKGAFVTPSDSVAIIADSANVIPYFKKGGVKGLARSMPTSKAIDLVAKKKELEYFEVPTGWKFFGNLMDAGRLSICGEESFGTGSDHIREKDGLWAIVAWLNILAAANKESPNKLIGIRELLQRHYSIYGRSFFSRAPGQDYRISSVTSFSYKDPIDGSVSTNQGQIVLFDDGSRVVFRLSGTGSAGATVRMYVERYVGPDAGPEELSRDTAEGLKGLIEVALEITKLKEFLERDEPTVITFRVFTLHP
ncbi:hypothetical protein EV401DRAFT_1923945 [Pisolithus croceorrhizus]|nr:hypothetical protein EV401DRAFT_1923945 [Pisolithus croceorrhizus]